MAQRSGVANLDDLAVPIVAHEGGFPRTNCVNRGVLWPIAIFPVHLGEVCFGARAVTMIGDDRVERERLVAVLISMMVSRAFGHARGGCQ